MEEEGWGLAFPVKLSHEPTMLSPLTDIPISATPPAVTGAAMSAVAAETANSAESYKKLNHSKNSSYVHMKRVNPTTHWIPGTLRRVAYQPFYRRRMPSRN